MQFVSGTLSESCITVSIIYLNLGFAYSRYCWLLRWVYLDLMGTNNSWNDASREIFTRKTCLNKSSAHIYNYIFLLVKEGLHLLQSFLDCRHYSLNNLIITLKHIHCYYNKLIKPHTTTNPMYLMNHLLKPHTMLTTMRAANYSTKAIPSITKLSHVRLNFKEFDKKLPLIK